MSKNYYTNENIQKFQDELSKARARIADGETLRVSISNGNSKMGPVASVSVLPFVTCPACCRNTCGPECYAAKLALLYPTVRESYARNTAILIDRPAQYWAEVKAAISAVRFFRFHVSGDIIDPGYFAEMVHAAESNHATEILCFTKRFQIVNRFLDAGGTIPANLHIMFSGWTNLQPENPHNLSETNVFDKSNPPREDWKQCGGNCFNCACRGVGCWTACPGDTIAFKKH